MVPEYMLAGKQAIIETIHANLVGLEHYKHKMADTKQSNLYNLGLNNCLSIKFYTNLQWKDDAVS